MGKRSASELVTEGLQDETAGAKRPRLQDTAAALSLLERHADDLVECLRSLRASHKSTRNSHLATLSHTLLPAFAMLGSSKDQDQVCQLDADKVPLDTSEKAANFATKQQQEVGGSKASKEAKGGRDHELFHSGTILTKWDAKKIPSSLPPLPEILDPAIEKVALTHSGTTNSNFDLSYERLEWIGDAYLYLIASAFIYQTFASLSPGRCSQLREQLVRNSTLGEYTRQYGLDKRASFPKEFYNINNGGNRATDKERKKALGDLFEAYVGAVIQSDPANGVARASHWLKELWSITLADQLREESRKPQSKSQGFLVPSLGPSTDTTRIETATATKVPEIAPKVRLAGEIACGKVAVVEYLDMDLGKQKRDKGTNLPLFGIGCYFTGWGEKKKLLGTGSDLSKKEAGQKAAKQALANRKLIQPLAEKKIRFLAEREAAVGKKDAGNQQIQGA